MRYDVINEYEINNFYLMKPLSLKEKAINLRVQGYSYNMISQVLGLSKSTMSGWLKEVPYSPSDEVIRRIGLARAKSAQSRHMVKIRNIKKAKDEACREIGKIRKRDLWFLGLGLYLGEGSKLHENIRIINSDPEIIFLAVKWFREICELETQNFTMSIHIYPDINEKWAKAFWSKSVGIPLSQFRKTQIDIRTDKTNKKRHKLLYGTAHLQVVARGKTKFGVFLHRKIIGWIEEIIKQSKNAGIAQR